MAAPLAAAAAAPDAMRRTVNLASALSFGIGLADEDELSKRLEAMELAPDRTSPAALADKVDSLVGMMQQLHVTSRDNNAILNQMLFAMEERINARINLVRDEMVVMINTKLAALGTAVHPAPPSTSGKPPAGDKPPARRPTVMKIFDSMESMGGAAVSETSGVVFESVQVTPVPGFVIKTRKLLGSKDKVFINVFHHEYIEVEPSGAAKAGPDNRPYLVIGEPTHLLDKDGHNCSTYNVGVSSEYFKAESKLDIKITSPQSIQKIIHKINIRFSEFLDESSYVLPRSSTGFKGDAPTQLDVMVPVKPATPAVHTSSGASQARRSSLATVSPKSMPESDSGARDSDSVVSELTSEPHVHALSSANVAAASAATRSAERHGSGIWETGSVTSTTKAQAKKKVPRKSIFDTSQLAISDGTVAGRNLLSMDMLEFVKEESVDNQTADSLKLAAADDPSFVLGWQISMMDAAGKVEMFVVTGVRKNFMSKTEFRVSRFGAEDQWVRLQRGEGKSGADFRPMRKVLFGLANDDESVA